METLEEKEQERENRKKAIFCTEKCRYETIISTSGKPNNEKENKRKEMKYIKKCKYENFTRTKIQTFLNYF